MRSILTMLTLGSAAVVGAAETVNGFRLHLTAPSDNNSYAVVLFVTGFSGLVPSSMYSDLNNRLSSKGYIVVGLDHMMRPNYPAQGKDFNGLMEWVKAGNLTQVLKDAKIDAVPDLNRVAVMGQSAGNHVVGQGLSDGCSLAKAHVLLDPVDGVDPYGFVHNQDLITPGQKMTYATPMLLLDNELDTQKKNFLYPACAPAKLGANRWFDAAAGPIFNVNASKYGHVDCLDDRYIAAGKFLCPTDKTTNKTAYRAHLASTIDLFLTGVFQGKTENFGKLEEASTFSVNVTVRQDLQGLNLTDIKPGCTNRETFVTV